MDPDQERAGLELEDVVPQKRNLRARTYRAQPTPPQTLLSKNNRSGACPQIPARGSSPRLGPLGFPSPRGLGAGFAAPRSRCASFVGPSPWQIDGERAALEIAKIVGVETALGATKAPAAPIDKAETAVASFLMIELAMCGDQLRGP